MRAEPRKAFQSSQFRAWLGLARIAMLPVLAACGDSARPLGPTPGAPALQLQGATKTHLEFPISVDNLGTPPCLDSPVHWVLSGTFTFDWTNTPSDISSGRASIVFDRSTSYVEYNGVTYHFAEGHPSHDLVQHFVNGPDGLLVQTGVFLDFQSSDTGDRLNLQAVFVMVIDPNGNARLDGINTGVLAHGNCAP
jgi:hypothetical protein